jgi:hypothetical protein
MTESLLIIVTAAALALAIAMGLILAILLREERRRSNARAALLAEMAAEDTAADYPLADPTDEFEIVRATSDDLFAPAPAKSPWPQRVAIAGALAVVLGGIGLLARTWPSSRTPVATVVTTPAASAAVLLDLLSLRHSQEAESLTITGLVQNPRSGTPLSKITATAMLFGADGAFISSGRTPLDLTTLRPGDESGFVITVPMAAGTAATVTRYRIGFRSEDGRVIGHIDRRTTPAIARGPS